MMRTLNPVHDETTARPDAEAGFGCLETTRGCLPLVALDVSAAITGLLAHTTVKQTFRNSLDEPLEATYIFPLPDRAAVTSFLMRVGDRVVEGQLKERGQARRDYRKAIEDGHRAALAEEDRSGTFCMQVGNIPPKEDVSVELTLVGPLPVSGGEATFRFPLVVAPRYTSGVPLDGPSVGPGCASDTDEVPDASRVTPPVLLPGFPNPVALSLEVLWDPKGLAEGASPEERFTVSLHSVVVEGPPWRIRLEPGERLNRDFLFRFPVAAEAVQTSLVASSGGDEKHETFALTIVPPATGAELHTPRDVVVVLDRSGSMRGWKMVAARRAVGRIVDSLLDADRFSVIAFDNTVETAPPCREALAPASDRTRWRTVEWLSGIDARGGTQMEGAVGAALRLLDSSEEGRQPILVLVTDGQVAGEDAILRAVGEASAGGCAPRIHTIGIDRAVNAGFLRRLAHAGGGTCDLVESEDRLDAAMDQIHRAIATAAITNLELEAIDGTLVDDSLAPCPLPDLFADRPVTVYGQYRTGRAPLRLRISGADAEGRPWQAETIASEAPADTIRSLWGRARVRDLEDRYAMSEKNGDKLAKQIVSVSLATHVLSRFTAYVAVDDSEVVNQGGEQQHVVQPVEIPDGWDVPIAMNGNMSICVPCVAESGPPVGGRSVERRHAYDVLVEIRELCRPVESKGLFGTRTRRKRLKRLLASLRKLVSFGCKSDLWERVLEELVQTVENRLEEYRQGKKEVLMPEPFNELLANVREKVVDLRKAFRQDRYQFWA